jgi:hypothetical protein
MRNSQFICPNCLHKPDGEEPSAATTDKHKNTPPSNASNNNMSTILKGTAITGGVVAVVCAVPILAGFGTAGIGAGSVAALWQSAIGNVAAGSLFASLQSLGATGTFVTGASSGLGVAGAAAGLRTLTRDDNKASQKNTTNSASQGQEDQDKNHEDEGENKVSDEVVCIRCGRVFNL